MVTLPLVVPNGIKTTLLLAERGMARVSYPSVERPFKPRIYDIAAYPTTGTKARINADGRLHPFSDAGWLGHECALCLSFHSYRRPRWKGAPRRYRPWAPPESSSSNRTSHKIPRPIARKTAPIRRCRRGQRRILISYFALRNERLETWTSDYLYRAVLSVTMNKQFALSYSDCTGIPEVNTAFAPAAKVLTIVAIFQHRARSRGGF